MALISCGECGSEVSDRAPLCPKCGVPIAADQVQLTVKGFPRRYMGAKEVEISLDGKRVGSVSKGATETVVLPSGGVVEFATQYMGKRRSESFNVPGGTVVDLECDFGPLGGLIIREPQETVFFTGFSMDL